MASKDEEIQRLLRIIGTYGDPGANNSGGIRRSHTLIEKIREITGSEPIALATDARIAYDAYKKIFPQFFEISGNEKTELKVLCEKGRELGIQANSARETISRLKKELLELNSVPSRSSEKVDMLLNGVATHRSIYDLAINDLKVVKQDIERIQAFGEERKKKIHNQFTSWLSDLQVALGVNPGPAV